MNKSLILATIIVNYKSEHRTITYVKEELLLKCTVPQIIVIVNNGATEVSSKLLCDFLDASLVNNINDSICDSKIYVIHNTENSGFAKGNNLGVDFISEHFNIKYLLFSNNDIRFIDSDIVERLIEKLDSLPDVGIIGPKIVGLDGNCQSPLSYFSIYNRMLGLYWGRFIGYKVKRINLNKARSGYYYSVMGSFFLTNYDDFCKCGKMDGNTFLYAEEVILAERMKLIEKKIFYYPMVSILHEHGVTTSKNLKNIHGAIINMNSLLYYYKTYLNQSKSSILFVKIFHCVFLYLQFYFRKIKNTLFL